MLKLGGFGGGAILMIFDYLRCNGIKQREQAYAS